MNRMNSDCEIAFDLFHENIFGKIMKDHGLSFMMVGEFGQFPSLKGFCPHARSKTKTLQVHGDSSAGCLGANVKHICFSLIADKPLPRDIDLKVFTYQKMSIDVRTDQHLQ